MNKLVWGQALQASLGYKCCDNMAPFVSVHLYLQPDLCALNPWNGTVGATVHKISEGYWQSMRMLHLQDAHTAAARN